MSIHTAEQSIGSGFATSVAVSGGQRVVDRLPLLAHHRGRHPDLVVKWNDMQSAPASVDVAVHLHGHSGSGEQMDLVRDKLPRSGLDWFDLTDPLGRSRSAATVFLLPRGHYTGTNGGKGYEFPALLPSGALPALIATGLAEFGGAAGVATPAMGRLILTAHSGGGNALMQLLHRLHDPDEIHVFDALYFQVDPLIAWTTRHIAADCRLESPRSALRVLHRAGTGAQSRRVGDAIAQAIQFNGCDPAVRRRYRVERTSIPHPDIPRHYGWRLFLDPATDVPDLI
jgi:hypothetical protein